jgi:hypothetical protein
MSEEAPAFYAVGGGGWRDWWTLLHPPYTIWHLSYVVLGAAIAPHVDYARLGKALVAFLLAMGIGAHALDELNGRPLRTQIPGPVLKVAALASIAAAVVLGVLNMNIVGWVGVPFICFGAFIVLAYNLEWFGGRFHSDAWFAGAWGAFPALVGYWAVAGRFHARAIPIIAACFVLSLAQRTLSTPVRALRRRTTTVEGVLVRTDGSSEPITRATMMREPEAALRMLSLAVPLLAVAALAARW